MNDTEMLEALSASYDKITASEAEPAVTESIESTEDAPAHEAAPVDDSQNSADTGTESEGSPADVQPVSPPDRWSAEDKAAFSLLPREAQELVLKREKDVEGHLTKKSQEIAEQRKAYEGLDGILAPRRQAWAMSGVSQELALSRLFELSDFASTDPRGFIKWFASQQGIDFGESTASEDIGDVDPLLARTNEKVENLSRTITQWQQAQEAQQTAYLQSQLDAFRADPKHPHYDDVRHDMAALISGGRAKGLEDAYEMACYANPAIRSKILEEQKKQEEVARLTQAKEAAAKAKKSAGTQITTRATVRNAANEGTIEDILAKNFDRIMARA